MSGLSAGADILLLYYYSLDGHTTISYATLTREYGNSLVGGYVKKLIGMFLLLIGASTLALADVVAAPEISPASAGSALALVSGALLIYRGRR